MKGSVFIVTGMPRSRTAWLANYLTYGDAFCKHELLSDFDTPKQCADWMKAKAESGVSIGMSDSGAVLFQDALAAELPNAKWVLIRRSVGDCEKSFSNEHGIGVDLWAHKRKVDDLVMHLDPMVVEFDEIDTRIRHIAAHCIPGWKHNNERHEMLLKFDVKLTDHALKSGIQAAATSPLLSSAEPPKFTAAMIRAAAVMEEALGCNIHALTWWRELCEVVDIYDHTVDGDGRDVQKTHRAFKSMMLNWPLNPFIRSHAVVMVPVMSAAISAWQYGGRAKAADIYTEVANAMIFLLHGQSGVERWMPEIRACHAMIMADDQRKDGD